MCAAGDALFQPSCTSSARPCMPLRLCGAPHNRNYAAMIIMRSRRRRWAHCSASRHPSAPHNYALSGGKHRDQFIRRAEFAWLERVQHRRLQDIAAATKGAIARPAEWRDRGWGGTGQYPRGSEDSCARRSLWSSGQPAQFARAIRGQHCESERHHSRRSPCRAPVTAYADDAGDERSFVPTVPGGRATSSDSRQAGDMAKRPSRVEARHLPFAGKQRTSRHGANILVRCAATAAHQDIDTDVRQNDEQHRHR